MSTSPGTKSDIDDVYPESAEETARMRELVDKADKAIIDESDTYIKCCLIDLEDILDWSGRRHWTIMWPVIIGVSDGDLPFLEGGQEAGRCGRQAGRGRSGRKLGRS